MKSNESTVDRIIRVVLAVVLGALVALKVVTGTVAILFGIVAAILFLTGVVGICLIYAMLGISTRKTSTKA